MGLLKITTTPIEYEIKIEKAKLKLKEHEMNESSARIRKLTQQKQISDRRVAANPQAINDAQRASENFQSVARQRVKVKSTPVNAVMPQNMNTVNTGQHVAAANASQQIKNVNVDSDYEFQTMAFGSPDSFYRESFSIASTKPNEWAMSKNELEFVPGRFKMEITQFPEVNIEYTGGFMYVPASADPEYEETQ